MKSVSARSEGLLSGLGGLPKAYAPLVLCLLLIGCAANPKKTPPSKPAPTLQPRKIGSIVMVNEELQFVLVEAINPSYMPPAGQALKSFSGGAESGILAVTPESKRPLVAADIVSGHPQKGDEVFE